VIRLIIALEREGVFVQGVVVRSAFEVILRLG
jgi:hypothetical protein